MQFYCFSRVLYTIFPFFIIGFILSTGVCSWWNYSEIFVCPINVLAAVSRRLILIKYVYIYIERTLVIILLFTNLSPLCRCFRLLLILDAFLIVCGAENTLFCSSDHEFAKGIVAVHTGKEYCTTSSLVLWKLL